MSDADSTQPAAELLVNFGDAVGESVVWDDRNGSILWVDIIGKRIHRLNLDQGTCENWDTPDFVTGIGLCKDGAAIVGLMKRVVFWAYDEIWKPFVSIETDRPHNRLNECGVAPDGSFWVGTMHNNFDDFGNPIESTEKTGAYYRIQADGQVARLTENIFGITNTMSWTVDHRFLTADTTLNQIFSFPYDSRRHELGEPVPFTEPFQRGLPDGSCLDSEGYLWNCRVSGGACLVRYAPDGRVDRVIELPCTWPTSCAFGGPDLTSLFVTSARFTMTPEHLKDHPQEGGLWRVDVGVSGLPCHRFGAT